MDVAPEWPAWTGPFLAAFSKLGNVSAACRAAHVSRQSAYDYRDHHEDFRAAWEGAGETSADLLEQEAFRRAAQGTEKPVYYRGREVGRVREYSDVLLIFLLKARRPDVYRERFEHTGAGGGPLQVALSSLEAIQAEQARIRGRLDAERGQS